MLSLKKLVVSQAGTEWGEDAPDSKSKTLGCEKAVCSGNCREFRIAGIWVSRALM